MFECVNIPELNHLSNVVVFSSKCIRPDTSKMSCGDLDGDVYLVIWDQNLLGLVHKSMIRYPAPLPGTLDMMGIEEFTESDKIEDFIPWFYERNFLGKLANTWVKLKEKMDLRILIVLR
jgi:RNA-dependent RNA polymerase